MGGWGASRSPLVLGVLLATVVVAACDQGSALAVQNDMDQALIARVSGTLVGTNTSAPYPNNVYTSKVFRVVEVAPHSRAVVVVLPFGGSVAWSQLDLLQTCDVVIASFHALSAGGVFVVSDHGRAEQRADFPRDTAAAAPSTRCPLPDASPQP